MRIWLKMRFCERDSSGTTRCHEMAAGDGADSPTARVAHLWCACAAARPKNYIVYQWAFEKLYLDLWLILAFRFCGGTKNNSIIQL
jgi:hypothetical protein